MEKEGTLSINENLAKKLVVLMIVLTLIILLLLLFIIRLNIAKLYLDSFTSIYKETLKFNHFIKFDLPYFHFS